MEDALQQLVLRYIIEEDKRDEEIIRFLIEKKNRKKPTICLHPGI